MPDASAPQPAAQPPLARERKWLVPLAITAVGTALRAWFVLWQHPIGRFIYSDMLGAYNNARTFADPHHVLNLGDTIKPRAMGFVGGFILRHFQSQPLQVWGGPQVVLSSATLPLLYIGTRRFFGSRAAAVATAFMALSYLPIGFAGFLMVETYLMFFLALAFALLDPERPLRCLLGGVALGLGCLFKPQGATIVPLWCLALFCWPQKGTLRLGLSTWLFSRRRLSAVLLGVGVLAAVVPETIAVSRLHHRLVFLSAYGGQNFYIGHCHVKLMSMDGGRDGSFFTAGVPKVYQRNEPWPDVTFHVSVFDNDFYVQEGLKCFRKSVGFASLWMVEQLADVFAGWPGSTIDPWPVETGWGSWTRPFNLAIGYVFAPLGLWALWRRRRDLGAWLGFGLPLASVWGLALIFSGDPRYREPFDLFFVAGGAWMLVELWDRLRDWLARRLGRPGGAPLPGSGPP